MIRVIKSELFKFFKNFIPDTKEEPSISNINIHGLNLTNPKTHSYPSEGKIRNIVAVMRELDEHITTHSLSHVQKNGKQINKLNFKSIEPKRYPTIGVTQWTSVDMLGCKNIKESMDIFNTFVEQFKKVKHLINYDKNALIPKKIKKTKGCPSGILPPVNGVCQSNEYLPIPNKHNTLCCYKAKLTPKKAINIVQKYYDAKLNIPKPLQDKINLLDINTTPMASIPIHLNRKKFQIFYKNKPFKCMTLPKKELQSIALSLNLNPKGKKVDLCERINKHYKNFAYSEKKRISNTLKRIAFKYVNMKS